MKVKGANFFELHIEKIVLALAAAVFVVVLVFQLGSDGPAVTVSGRTLPLDQAYEPAEELARQARTRISTQDPELPEVAEQVNLLASFRQAREADLAPRDRIALGPDITLAVGEAVDGFENAPLADLSIPAPHSPAAYAFAGTLDPWVVEETEGLGQFVPPSQPYDAVAVSVQATFDSEAFINALSAEPPEGRSAWPVSWWRGGMEIFAVRLERQQQNADGSWSAETERIPTPPGRLDLPAELAEAQGLTPGELKRWVEDVRRTLIPQVRRPDFYPIIAGEPWMEPREGARVASLEAGENPEVAALQRRLARVDERIERVVADLAALGATPDPDAGPAGRPAPGGQQQQQDRAREGQIRRLRANYDRLDAERESIVTELTDLGFAPEGADEAAEQEQQQRRPRGAREASPDSLVSGLPIEVWSHDLTAQPGQTYRYRVVLEFNNPAYGQEQFLPEEQRNLAEAATVFSQPSEWTEPVTASPTSAFFVTGGNEVQQGATGVRMASANIDVFTFFYGYYRKGSLTLEPGEPAAAWAELPENLPIFDTEQPRPQDGPAMPAPIAERDPRPGAARPAGEGLGTRTLAEADAYLLDVYESAAREVGGMTAGRPPRIVTFGASTGQIIRREVELDRRSPLYARLNASAEAGRTQGQPEPEAEEEQEQRRPIEAPELPPGIPPGGGGGGG